jgi:hypothetical protein
MKRPSFQFYPGDWLKDPGLRAVSLAARGLWMDMIAIMSQVEEPYGHLLFSSANDPTNDGGKAILRPIGPADLARTVGKDEVEVSACLAELERCGVFSRTAEGIIFSRRMIKDEKGRQVQAIGGYKSLEHPNVPRRKTRSEDRSRDTPKDTLLPSVRRSPSSSSSSSSKYKDTSLESELSEEAVSLIYDLYPRHIARVAAEKAIRKAVKRVAKLDGVSQADALGKLRDAVKLYVDQERREGTELKFILHPAKWFNEERYNDDLSPTPSTSATVTALDRLNAERANA